MAAFRFDRRSTRRRWAFAAAITAIAAVLLFVVGSAIANVGASKFEGGDGNLVVNTAGNTDWANVSGLNKGIDDPSGNADNSFGQGTKEDNAAVTVVSGSIPPNKSDLTRFYEASENVSGDVFVYLAWERTNVLGTANMDFELNQNSTAGFTGAFRGPITINRTPGDILITYDFANGGSKPTLGLRKWTGSAWGPSTDISAAGVSEGAINTVAVTDPISGGNACPSGSCPAFTFGEASIDLTAAGVFTNNSCGSFGSVFLKSRSSTSFTSEVKDFVAPVPVHITNCGSITIRKVTVPSPDPLDTTFSYTTTKPAGNTDISDFQLKNGQNKPFAPVHNGSYSVTETANSNYSTTVDCSASSNTGGSTENITGAEVDINLLGTDSVDCTYTNTLLRGAISIHKVSSKGGNLAGATFTYTGSDNVAHDFPSATDANGNACVDNLGFGTYTVAEKAAPSGYAADSNSQQVTISSAGTCTSGATAASSNFVDTPLTTITATATSEATGGTNTQITCVNSSNANVGTSPSDNVPNPSVTAQHLTPGTYTCTLVVDP